MPAVTLLEIPYPQIDPVALDLPGPIDLRWYGLMYLVGFTVAYFVLRWLARKEFLRLDPDALGDLIFALVLGVILGGRIGYILFYDFGSFLENQLRQWRTLWPRRLSGCPVGPALPDRPRGAPAAEREWWAVITLDPDKVPVKRLIAVLKKVKAGLPSRGHGEVDAAARVRNLRTFLVLAGTGGAVFVGLATLHCGPFTAVASLVQRTPLYALVRTAVAMPIVYGFVAASAGGLVLGFPRHRRVYPLLVLFAGLSLVVYTWHHALETVLWFTLAFSSLAALVLAAAMEFWLGRPRNPSGSVSPHSQPTSSQEFHSAVTSE